MIGELFDPRKEFGKAVTEYAAEHPEVVVLSADSGKSSGFGDFAERYPERYFECGIMEQGVVGMAAGCIPIVGFNMGAGLKPRVKALFTKLLTWEALVGFAALLLVEFFPRQLIGIFGAANESAYYTDFAIRAFRVYLCMLPLACVNKACFIFLQAMGKAAESTALSMIREVVFGVGFAMLLPKSFALSGVLYSMPVSDVLTFAVAAVLIAKTYRELGAAK